MSEPIVRTRRWTRFEYDKLIDAGFLGPGDKIELLAGQLCVSEPQNSLHAKTIWLGQEVLRRALALSWGVRARLLIALDEEPLRPSVLTAAPTCASSRRCSGTNRSKRRRSTLT